MAEKRKPFRFRLPWSSPQRTTPQPQRPRPTSKTTRPPSQPTTAVPIQRRAKVEPQSSPPSSSSAAAEATKTSPLATDAKQPQSSPAATESPKITSPSTSSSGATTKPPSPSSAADDARKDTSHSTSSPSRTTVESPKANSQTSSSPSATTAKQASPSSAAAEPRKDTSQSDSSPSSATAIPPSPPRAATESPKATSRPSPSHAAAESRVDFQTVSPSQKRDQSKETFAASSPSKGDSSPSRAASQETTSEVSSPSRKANQEELAPTNGVVTDLSQKKWTSQTPLQEPEPIMEITSETSEKPDSRDDEKARDDSTKASSPAKATPASGEATDEPVSSIAGDQKPRLEFEREPKEPIQEIPKEEKTAKATDKEEPTQKTVIEASGTRKGTKETHNIARKAPRKKRKQETSERKETITSTSSIGKQIKTVIPSQPTEEAPQQREIKKDIFKLVRTLTIRPRFDEKPVTVVTLTGHNRGALMQLTSEAAEKEGSIHIHRGYQTDPDESHETTTDGEASNNGKEFNDRIASGPIPCLNGNAQSVNNSIVFEASVTERSPGVHLSFSRNTSSEAMINSSS
ncbi:hypothetical protein L484_025896 [Morus notabilis]|uniref:Uncharacterized protein n=1 Tax=Morus notabilis TaxID=981085 RepID=W9RAV0_9ROSA|nr:mucin-5AC [Morus notabilis]EXB65629.1 hypothetical protein L484_025896 [Morus notabilis]